MSEGAHVFQKIYKASQISRRLKCYMKQIPN